MRPGACLSLRSLVRCALFVAAGIVLGQLFHLVGMGPTFLPLHLPAQIGGLLLGAQAGLLIGLCTPPFFWHLGLPRLSVAQNAWLAFLFGFPGVCLQLALVPAMVALLKRHLDARRRDPDPGSPLPGFLTGRARKGLEVQARRLPPGGEEESP